MTFELTRLRAVVLALAMLLTTALLIEVAQPAGADAAAKKTKKKKGPKQGPAGLKFYSPPKKLPTAHGKLIWQRKAGGSVPLKSAASTKLVLYTSRSTTGKQIAVSGSVSIPKGKAPKGGWPIISYAHGTTGIADKCAPSRNTKGGVADPYISYMDPLQNAWLRAGYAVARTDYQGLGVPGVNHPFLVGVPAGRSVLDIVSASRQLGLKIGNRYLIAGHSQGGHAALFAAGLASSYSKDIKLRGTVSYAPASHFKEQASFLPGLTSPNGLTALATLLVRGMSISYPQLNANEALSDTILPFYPQTLTKCLSELAGSDNLGGIAPSELIRSGYDMTPLNGILEAQNPSVATSAPILLAQGTADSTTFPFLTDQLDTELVGKGDTVDYKKYEGVDHGGVVAAAQNDVMSFFESRLPSGK
ncbi:MAG TPA: lipase family protein [Solirubrobacterales bacterium]|nr:lipase family protein [Solirubrobacterales bacterium]HNG56123.1 lipase family protein [Solirubrobacterales bacterium]HNK34593.1 lipase family protein [Solirubrobacterales bacterium]